MLATLMALAQLEESLMVGGKRVSRMGFIGTFQLALGAGSAVLGLSFLVAGRTAPVRLAGSGLVLIGAVATWDALVSRGHGHTIGGLRHEAFERQAGDGQIGPAPGDEIGDDDPADGPQLEPVARIAEAVNDAVRRRRTA